ncbi:MAG: sugar phosphate isomerase/epimerase [Alphaproteobacteria bacterium]
MRVGIFTGYFDYPLADCARRVREAGFTIVQLDFKFPDIATSTAAITAESCRRIRQSFAANDIGFAAVSGYVNLIAPQRERKRAARDRLARILGLANELGSSFVVTETGTKHPEDDWAPHPDTARPEVYQEFRDEIGAMAEIAHRHDAVLLIEGAVGNVIDDPAKVERLFADVPSPSLGLLMDPTNYLDASNLDDQRRVIDCLFAPAIAARAHVAHAKDVRRIGPDGVRRERHNHLPVPDPHAEWPAAGLGEMDYDLYLGLLARRHGDIALILEHIEESDVPRAKRFVEQKLAAAGAGA